MRYLMMMFYGAASKCALNILCVCTIHYGISEIFCEKHEEQRSEHRQL